MNRFKLSTMAIALTLVSSSAFAETDLEAAMNGGGQILKSDQIAQLIMGKVVTAKAGNKTFRFFYNPDNVVDGELTNGGWKGSGVFAITDNDQVCVSMAADKGRYRCLTAVQTGEKIQKFNTAGKMTFELLGFEPAKGL